MMDVNMKWKTYYIAFLFFMIDLISKQIVSHVLVLNKSVLIIDNFFYLTYTKNSGAAWSIFEDERLPLLMLTVIVIFVIYRNLKNVYLNLLLLL